MPCSRSSRRAPSPSLSPGCVPTSPRLLRLPRRGLPPLQLRLQRLLQRLLPLPLPATRTPELPAAAPAPGPSRSSAPTARRSGDTQGLAQFETGVEYAPRGANDLVSFSLEDADLPELVRVIGELTGKRFIFGGKVQQHQGDGLLAAEGHRRRGVPGVSLDPRGQRPDGRPARALLQDRRLAGREDGRPGRTSPGQGGPGRGPVHHAHPPAPERRARRRSGNVLGHFKSKDGDITVYGPGNLLIITDTGTNIQRMMRILEDVDVGGVGDRSGSSRSTTASRPTSRRASTRSSTSRAARAGGQAGREGGGRRRWAATSTSRRSSPTTGATRSSSSRPSARTCASSSSSSASTSRCGSGEGEIHVARAPARGRRGAREDAQRDRHGRGRGRGRRPAAAAPKPGTTPLDDLRVGREGQRRQGHQLDRRHLEPARLREPAHRHRQARPAAPPGLHRGRHHGPARSTARTSSASPSTGVIAANGTNIGRPPARRSSTAASIRSGRFSFPARRTRPSTPSRSASAARASRQREPPRHGLLHPGLRRAHQRPGEHERRRHPLHAAHPGDRQHPRGDQRRPEHPAADQRRRVRQHPGLGRRRCRAPRRRWAPSGGSASAVRDRASPGHRHQGQDRRRT